MGVDITITMGHGLADLSMPAVSLRFRELHDAFVKVARFASADAAEIDLTSWRDLSHPEFAPHFYWAPAGFSVFLGKAALRFHHGYRFKFFVSEEPVRSSFRHFARECASLLRVDRVIYAPDEGVGEKIDDLVRNGRTIGDIEGELFQLSPPAATFEELAARQMPPWTKPAYYVDRFEDILI